MSSDVQRDDRNLEAELASADAGRVGIPVDAICVGCGRIRVKRGAHEQLLEASGMYLLVVYLPRPGLPQVARAIVPATLVDELLSGRWYGVGGSRSEQEVAKLAWSHVIDPAGVDPSVTVGYPR